MYACVIYKYKYECTGGRFMAVIYLYSCVRFVVCSRVSCPGLRLCEKYWHVWHQIAQDLKVSVDAEL